MKKRIRTMGAFLLVAVMVLTVACAAACGDPTPPPPEVPDTGYPVKSDLAYGDALDPYKKTDFTAAWIWTPSTTEDSYVAFRKTFDLAEAPGEVTAYVSAESKYFMWVNGELTVYDGSVKRGPTPYDSYYDTVAVDGLKAGKNTLAFLVPYNGRSGDSSIDGMLALGEGEVQGGLLFEMKAGDTVIKSDHTFKARRLTEYKNRILLGSEYPAYSQTSMLAERNMWYDARDSVGDFMSESYDDSAWESATLIAKAGALPFGDLYASDMPLIKFGELTDLESAESVLGTTLTEDRTLTFALPENMQFSPYFELEAPAGKKITYYTDTFTIGGTTTGTFKDTYVTKEGAQSYESYPWRSGSELIVEAEAGVKFTRVGYRPSGYGSERTGAFVSSDEDLNVLWEKCANTLELCMRDSFMDCPERERGPYMGDATNEMDITYYAMDTDALALIKKTILACVGWTGKDKLIPSRAPSNKPHEIPAQSLAFSTAVYNYLMQTGDTETVKAYYAALIEYLKVWNVDEDGMPVYRTGEWTWTDWGSGADVGLIQVCWYYYSMACAQNMADALGISADDAFLNERMAGMRASFDELYKKADGFRSGDDLDDRANALAVLSGLAGEDDYALVTGVLRDVRLASPFMERFVLEALCVMGEYELAAERMKLRYGEMIDSDYTTIWELFDGLEGGTPNHGWSCGPLMILSRYFGGIAPTAAGYESYEIAPQALFDSLKTSVDTVKGRISMEYVRSSGGTTFTLTTVDADCTVRIPLEFGEVESCEGLTVVGTEDGCTVLTVSEAGEYTVKTK